MTQQDKCVMIINERLPLGFIANTAAILGISIGKNRPQDVGAAVTDASGCEHLGIIEYPVPILRATPELLRQTRQRLNDPDFRDVTVVDFTDLAQGCKTYGEFMDKMALTVFDDLEYYGLALCGPRKKVNQLTGSLPLLRGNY